MTTVAIIGASRGIGLELARQYAGDGCRVHATTRTPDALGDIDEDVNLHPLDVVEDEQIVALADALSDEPIDILIHNAGINAAGVRATPRRPRAPCGSTPRPRSPRLQLCSTAPWPAAPGRWP